MIRHAAYDLRKVEFRNYEDKKCLSRF